MVVDLPAPFGPRRATVSPRRHLEAEVVDRQVGAVAVAGAFEAQGGRGAAMARRVQGKRSEGHCRPSVSLGRLGQLYERPGVLGTAPRWLLARCPESAISAEFGVRPPARVPCGPSLVAYR